MRRDEEREARLGAEERQKAATVLSRLSTAPSSNGTSTTHNIGLPINPASQNLSTALAARQARTASSQASSSLTALSTTPPIRLSHPPRIQSSPLTSIHSSTPSQPSVSWHGSASVHNAFRHLQLDVEFEDIEEEEEPVEDRPPRDPSVDHARLLGAKLGLESTSGDRDDGLGQVDVGMVVEVEEVVPVPEGDGMVVEEGDRIPGPVGDGSGEEDWELEYDLDDQREQEALENAGNQVEEEGESELDDFTSSSESGGEDSLDVDRDLAMELARMEDDGIDYQERNGSEDGVVIIPEDDQENNDSSSVDTNHDQPPLGDE